MLNVWQIIIAFPFVARKLIRVLLKIRESHPVDEPHVGSVVFCDLLKVAEHSGIYVGEGSIVWLSSGGEFKKGSPEHFTTGMEKGKTVYVSCKGKSPVGSPKAAERALHRAGMIYHQHGYNVRNNNCHMFTSGCLTGDFRPDKYLFSGIGVFTLLALAKIAKESLGYDCWRPWAFEKRGSVVD